MDALPGLCSSKGLSSTVRKEPLQVSAVVRGKGRAGPWTLMPRREQAHGEADGGLAQRLLL